MYLKAIDIFSKNKTKFPKITSKYKHDLSLLHISLFKFFVIGKGNKKIYHNKHNLFCCFKEGKKSKKYKLKIVKMFQSIHGHVFITITDCKKTALW